MKHACLFLPLALLGGCTALQLERPPEQDAEMRLEQGLASLDAGLYAEAFDDLAWVYTHCAGRQAGYRAMGALAGLELDPRNRMGRERLGTELLARFIQDPGPPQWTRPMAESAYLMGLALGAESDDGTPAPEPGDSATTPVTASPAASGPTPGSGDDAVEATADAGAPAAQTAPAAGGSALPSPAGPDGGAYGCGPRIDADDWVAPAVPTLPGPSMLTLLTESEAEREALAERADSLLATLTTVRGQLAETEAELERIRKTLRP